MGRSRRKYGKVEKESVTPACKVEIDGNCSQVSPADSNTSNMFVVSGTRKKAGKTKPKVQPKVKKLSKKQRKSLQIVLEQKEKKLKRADLMEELSKVQVQSTELALMSSIAHLGTKNASLNLSKRPLPEDMKEAEKLNSIRGFKRRRKQEKKIPDEAISESEESSDISLSSDDELKPDEDKQVLKESNSVKEPEEELPESEPQPDKKHHSGSDGIVDADVPETNLQLSAPPSVYVPLDRDPLIQEERLKLPILAEEQAIMEAIRYNQVVIICGETGSGKTTQIPQFLYEAGYGNEGIIGVTEPRRVAAISMSERVAKEMNLPQSKVSHQVRYEGNVTPSTQVKFMTDGVLLREVQKDFLLSKYSAIIIDEAHERSVYTDVLIGLLSRIVPLRNKREKSLRLIIMSATLRVESFTENVRLFKNTPPVITVKTRQYPVTVHFNKTTPVDTGDGDRAYINAAYKKVCKIHRTLPAGGILVFVTGQNEVHSLCKRLRLKFPKELKDGKDDENGAAKSSNEEDKIEECGVEAPASASKLTLPDVNLSHYPKLSDKSGGHEGNDGEGGEVNEEDDRDALAGFSEEEDSFSDDAMDNDDDEVTWEMDQSLPMHVLPLYSLLAPSKQRNVFKCPRDGIRTCIVATNVAETSLTIPGIKYVVDTGKVKKRFYDKVTGISSFQVTWVSKASADQRAGRAGRLGPGHAYRLYSSAVFQDFQQFSTPEITSRPAPGLVLQMKHLNIERVVNFPFPTPPPEESLKAAEELLLSLGAVEVPKPKRMANAGKVRFNGRITALGRAMAEFPVHPRFGKMLATACTKEHKELLPYVIAIVAALTVREVFIEPQGVAMSDETKAEHRQALARLAHLKTIWGGGNNKCAKAFGDLMVLLGAVGSAEYTGLTPEFCNFNCLRFKSLVEIRKLRSQLTNIVNSHGANSDIYLDAKMVPPSNAQLDLLRQIVLSAMGDHVARKIPTAQLSNCDDPQQVRRLTGAYSCLLTTDPVFIHPTSVLAQSNNLPDVVVFQEIIETKKSYMRGVFEIDKEWLARLCPQHCTFSQVLDEPSPYLDKKSGHVRCHANATYGRLSWPLGAVEIDYPAGLDRYKWFARFLLEEYIVAKLPRQFGVLMSRPDIMTKTWANLQPRTQLLLQELLKEGVDCREKLTEAWKKEPTYLLSAFRQWLPESIRNTIDPYWPPHLPT